jgi:hypothetical protein
LFLNLCKSYGSADNLTALINFSRTSILFSSRATSNGVLPNSVLAAKSAPLYKKRSIISFRFFLKFLIAVYFAA